MEKLPSIGYIGYGKPDNSTANDIQAETMMILRKYFHNVRFYELEHDIDSDQRSESNIINVIADDIDENKNTIAYIGFPTSKLSDSLEIVANKFKHMVFVTTATMPNIVNLYRNIWITGIDPKLYLAKWHSSIGTTRKGILLQLPEREREIRF